MATSPLLLSLSPLFSIALHPFRDSAFAQHITLFGCLTYISDTFLAQREVPESVCRGQMLCLKLVSTRLLFPLKGLYPCLEPDFTAPVCDLMSLTTLGTKPRSGHRGYEEVLGSWCTHLERKVCSVAPKCVYIFNRRRAVPILVALWESEARREGKAA